MQNFHNCHACVEQVLSMFGSVVGVVIIALDLQFHQDILGHFLRHSTQLDGLVCSLVCPRHQDKLVGKPRNFFYITANTREEKKTLKGPTLFAFCALSLL